MLTNFTGGDLGGGGDVERPTNVQTALPYRLDVQGLRAVAVLLVVAYHAGLPVPGGFIGVDVFFVISGYVITGVLLREWASSGRIRFGAFYWRRFKRLIPALAVMVSVVVLLAVPLLSPFGVQQRVAETAIGVLTITANAVIAGHAVSYDAGPAETNALLNTWSLSVEEQFYLLFPALLALGWWLAAKARRRRAPLVIVGVVAVSSFTVMLLHTGGHSYFAGQLFGFYSPLPRAWEFAAGALIALVHGSGRIDVRAWMSAFAHHISLLLLLLSAMLISNGRMFLGASTLLPVACTALLLFSGESADGSSRRLLTLPWLVLIGDWSYSIYLWHWPLIVVAKALVPSSTVLPVVVAVLSVIPAVLSYRFIEQPLRRRPTVQRTRAVQVVLASVLPPALLAGGLGVAAGNDWWSLGVRPIKPPSLGSVEQRHLGDENCFGDGVSLARRWSVEACTWNADASGRPIYLVGDSNAWQFGEALSIAAQRSSRSLTERTVIACPFAYVVLQNYEVPSDCQRYLRESLQWLMSARPGTVVISQSDYYWRDRNISAGLVGGTQTQETPRKLAAFERGLTDAVRTLQDAGHDVLLVETIPNFVAFGSSAWYRLQGPCNLLNVVQLGTMCRGIATTTEEVRQRQGATWRTIRNVAETTGARTMNVMSELCPDGLCAAYREGRWVYSDVDHITSTQSAALAPAFERALGQ